MEEVSFAAVVESRISVNAQEVALAVAGLLIETIFAESEAIAFRVFRALESEVAGGIAVRHYIGPVAVIGLWTESQSFGALEQVSTAVDAIQELITLVRRASHPKVSELMWTVLGWVGGLKKKKKPITSVIKYLSTLFYES